MRNKYYFQIIQTTLTKGRQNRLIQVNLFTLGKYESITHQLILIGAGRNISTAHLQIA